MLERLKVKAGIRSFIASRSSAAGSSLRGSSLRVHCFAFIAAGSSLLFIAARSLLRGSSLRVHRCAFTLWNSEACVPQGSSLRVYPRQMAGQALWNSEACVPQGSSLRVYPRQMAGQALWNSEACVPQGSSLRGLSRGIAERVFHGVHRLVLGRVGSRESGHAQAWCCVALA
jgi:hypothetical protein